MSEAGETRDRTAEVKLLFNRYREFLEEHIDPDSGILDKLLANNSLTNKEFREIKENTTVDKRNSRLLDYIQQKNIYDQFIRTLSDAKQIHIVNYVLSNGERKPEFGSEWPLTQQEVTTLNRNQEGLVNLLDTCDLIGRLFSCGVISMRQWNFILSKQPTYEKNEALLEILRRSSLNAYWQTIRCLHESNQSNIAKILAEGGVLPRLDVNLEGEGLNVSQAEVEIVQGITSILGNLPSPERSRIYELVELSLAGASLGHSVSLYFHCFGLSDLERIEHLIVNGRLKDIVETVFNRFTSAAVRVNLKSATDSFNKCREFFTDNIPMSPQHTQNLMENRVLLLSELILDDKFLDVLIANKTLTFSMLQEIQDKKTHMKKVHTLLNILPRLNEKAYSTFIDALMETHQESLALLLDPSRARPAKEFLSQITTDEAKPQGIKKDDEELGESITTVNDLPPKVVDVILQKAYLQWILNENYMMIQLASVNVCWLQRIRKHKFRSRVRKLISDVKNKMVCDINILRRSKKASMAGGLKKFDSGFNVPQLSARFQSFESKPGFKEGYFDMPRWFETLDTGSADESGFYSHEVQESWTTTGSVLSRTRSKESLLIAEDTKSYNCYKMDHPRRGRCIIINNEYFSPIRDYKNRIGSATDAANMERVFRNLNFEVLLYENLTAAEMLKLTIEVSEEDHQDCDCLAMVILTHGDGKHLIGVDANPILLGELILPLKERQCGLTGKPKLFFIGAGGIVTTMETSGGLLKSESAAQEADCLYALSAGGGHYSFRNTKTGSWFIQALTRVLDEYGTKMEILKMLTRVNRIVVEEFESKSQYARHSGKKQIPSIVSTLTKELYFKQK